MNRRLFLAVALALLVGWLAPGARAADAPPTGKDASQPTEVAKQRARTLHKEGSKLFVAGRNEEALAAFVAAWALVHDSSLAGNLAECEIRLGRYRDAAEHIQWILDDPTAPKALREGAAARLKDMAARVATVRLTVSDLEARVYADDVEVDGTPKTPLYFAPGEHRFVAKKPGYKDTVVVKTLAAGSEETVILSLEAAVTPASTPAASSQPPPPPPPMADGPSMRTILLGTGLGVTGVGLALGATFTVLANGRASDADDTLEVLKSERGSCATRPEACASIQDGRAGADDFGSVAAASFAVGSAALLGTAAVYLWMDEPTATTVSATPESGGLMMRVGTTW